MKQERLLGNEHPHTLETSQALALTLVQLQSQYEEAEMRQRKVLEVYLRTHVKHHIATWDSLDHLGIILQRRGKHDEAFTLYPDLLDDVHRSSAPTIPQPLRSKTTLLSFIMSRVTLRMRRSIFNRRWMYITPRIQSSLRPFAPPTVSQRPYAARDGFRKRRRCRETSWRDGKRGLALTTTKQWIVY